MNYCNMCALKRGWATIHVPRAMNVACDLCDQAADCYTLPPRLLITPTRCKDLLYEKAPE